MYLLQYCPQILLIPTNWMRKKEHRYRMDSSIYTTINNISFDIIFVTLIKPSFGWNIREGFGLGLYSCVYLLLPPSWLILRCEYKGCSLVLASHQYKIQKFHTFNFLKFFIICWPRSTLLLFAAQLSEEYCQTLLLYVDHWWGLIKY